MVLTGKKMQGAEKENQVKSRSDGEPIIINMAQENEDDRYTCGTTETSSDLEHSEKFMTAAATNTEDHSEEKPGGTMCHNFVRGTCKEGAACMLAHTLILSQLPGVYTFCTNFQNSVCAFPMCEFVHATVVEKEIFFRTGYIPPHSLAHLKEASVLPASASQSEEAGLPPVCSNGTPTPTITCVPPTVVQYTAQPDAENSDPNIYFLQSVTSNSSPKRAWSDEACSSTGDRDSSEPLVKKCKDCDSGELRDQLIRAKVEKLARDNNEMAKKIAQVETKIALRAALFQLLFASNVLQITADKEPHNYNGFVDSPKEDMTIAGVVDTERLDVSNEPEEEHQSDDLERENVDNR